MLRHALSMVCTLRWKGTADRHFAFPLQDDFIHSSILEQEYCVIERPLQYERPEISSSSSLDLRSALANWMI